MIDDIDEIDGESSGTDIAIVGMSGRFPGASDVAGLWSAIRSGRSGITRFTDDELRAAGVPEELIADPSYVKASPVIDGVELFDAGFFGIGPKEAQILDPQHRLFLEHGWTALEDAGCDPTRFDGAVGVFAGCAHSSYMQNNLLPSGIGAVMGELAVGLANDKDSLTTRVAHTLGLSGPSYGVQSYCSTSLVAVCAAATSLASFECDLALAGGVAVNVPHRVGYLYQQGGIAPPDGECRAFDAGGLGAPLGSGVGVVALRRLEDALADGDQIYAVLRGWAVNNDAGRKVGFTAPGVQGQAAVMAEALASAGLTPADIDYVEAHGTGTALGDAAELAALQQVFRDESVLIGSVKTNLGHLDRAAGVTNLIKVALSLRHDEIPPTVNLTDPNPQLASGQARLEIVTGLRRWPREAGRTRRAGVSAFGIGGTNAHVVVEEAPLVPRTEEPPRPELLVWSARTASAADAMTERLAAHLAADGATHRLADVAHTLQTGRQVFAHRRMAVASSTAEAAGRIRSGAVLGGAGSRADRPVAFLVAGTGEQYPGMAAELYESEPVFRAALDKCRAELRRRTGGEDPLAEMVGPRRGGEGDALGRLLGRASAPAAAPPTRMLQPALFAVEYALARLVQSWGVEPAALAGYSLGEYVAACLAGVMSLESAVALVAHRAALIDELPPGEMCAVPLAAADLRERLSGVTGVDVAAVSGPELTVLAGEPAAMAAARALLEADGVPSRPLATSHAFHSRMMEPLRERLTTWIAGNITLHAPRVPVISNVTGEVATAAQLTDPAYWAEHMCATVRFDDVLGTLLRLDGDAALLEIGPGQSLGAMARGHRDCPPDRWPLVVATLPGADDPRPAGEVLAEAAGRLWLAGVPIDWSGYRQDRPVAKVGLPTYPFERERYWIDPPSQASAPAAVGVAAGRRTSEGGVTPQGLIGARPSFDADVAGVARVAGVGGEVPAGRPHVELLAPEWIRVEAPESGAPATVGRCVLVASGAAGQTVAGGAGGEAVAGDADGRGTEAAAAGADAQVAEALARSLRAHGVDVVTVTGRDDPAALTRGPDASAPATVVDLRLLAPASGTSGAGDGLVPVARLLAAIGERGGDGTRVLLVTRGAQAAADGEVPDAAHAAAATLPMVANQEYLSLDCAAVDLDPDADAQAVAAALNGEILNPSGEVFVAYRDGARLLRAFTPAEPPAPEPPAAATGRTYLVTGGLGDVGLIVAEHLARAGAARLVLTSRAGLPAEPGDPRREAVERIRALGAEVLTPAVDVTDASAMRATLAGLADDGAYRLDGVVHAAADTRPGGFRPLRDLDDEAVARHFAAKVTGAQVLEQVLGELPAGRAPRFCLVFSSTSAVLGGITFGSYAAANAALTALAHRGNSAWAEGRTPTRWVAASWDTWAVTLDRLEGGMGAAMAAHSMSAAESLAAFDRLTAATRPGLVVAAGGLDDRLPRSVPAATALLAGSAPGADEEGPSGDRFPRPELPQPYTPPQSPVEHALAGLWSEVLGVEPVGTRDNFFDLGGNSLVALQMLALVKQRFGVAVPTVALFEAPTVGTLAVILDERGATATATATAPSVIEPAPLPAVRVVGERARTATDDDRRIAIIGMAGRFPGAPDVATFWRNLSDGVESISFFSEEELLAAGADPGQIKDPAYVPARPVLDDVSGFDAAFFGMSPRMAAITDPQQRAFLEVCWEALEQGGYAAPAHRGRVGVFGGANISTYLLRMTDHLLGGGQKEFSGFEVIMGNDKDALTTTVSYLFDLYGPSVAVQTFCSTSLVAAHLAVQSLRAGDCELALAGGVSIRVPDRVGHLYGPGGQESPDGHVRAFDAAAKGSMFGDGAAAVLLKRLPDAIRDGDHVWAVIRGSAMNNDGALKVGYTAPSVVGQSRVIADAMADAGVTGEDISYVEAHGTATELGDPIEVAALTRAFGATRERRYCPIGSVKTNVGHLDRAAGASGLIKTSLAAHHGVIPASLHYTSPNPEIDFDGSPFYVNAELSPWRTRDGRPRIAGLNSLGMGGTNVHMVVEEPPARDAGAAGTGRRYEVVAVSARTAAAADEACRRLGRHLGAEPGTRLADVAYTLQVGRKTFEHRRAVVAGDVATAAAALDGRRADDLLGRVETVQGRQVAFLFAGVGEQYPGLAGDLYRHEPAFRAALDECLAHLAGALDGVVDPAELIDLLTGERGESGGLAALLGRAVPSGNGREAALRRTEVVQPALFAVEYALARTLMAWGLQPRLMLGYSLGEYVAACLSGVLSLPDAVALVAHRARLIARMPAGSMLAVSLPPDRLRTRFRLDGRGLDVAAVNGPQVTVVAGPVEDVERLAKDLRAAEVPCRPLETTHAFHSRMLEPLAEELTRWVAANVRLNPPALPYVSNLTGAVADAALVQDPGYWARHMCGTVRFADGIGTLLADPGLAVVEIGPGQSLGAMVRGAGCPPERWPLVTHTLPAAGDTRPGDEALAGALARLWLCGVTLDWDAYHGRTPEGSREGLPGRVPLPTYPFQRQRYWIDPPAGARGPAGEPAAEAPADLFEAITSLPKLPEEQWLYLPVWRQTAPPAAAERQPGSWLVFTRDGLADEAADRLRAAVAPTGAAVTVVRPGDAYAATADGYTIRPGDVADSLALLRDLRLTGRPLDRVVHLWTLDAPGTPGADASSAPAQAVDLGLRTLVALARAAGESGIGAWSLDVAVAGTQPVLGDEVADPYGATLLGPCAVIPLEYPGVTTRLVDLPAAPGTRDLDGLAAELARPQTDRTVALRRGRRWIPGYDPLPAPPPLTDPLREGGVYLVTGGLGGIALGLAEHLVRACRARLVLLARHGLPPRADWAGILSGDTHAGETTRRRVRAVAELEALGGEVEIVTGDVSRPEDVRRAVDTAVARFGALHGVLHAAGVPAMGLMQFKRPEELDEVLAPKLAGTLALAEALRLGRPDEAELDFLVLFSSITSATGGGPGQVDYCAANAFLDAYAHRLAATGRRVVSVGWGEWTWNAWEAGLAGYEEALRDFFRQNRARVGIAFDDGWRSLLRALATGEPRVVVSTQDFPTLVRGSSEFTVDVVTSPAMGGASGERHPRPELLTAYQEPDGHAEETIAAIWGESLRLDRVGVLDNFFELGGNSLLGVAIVAAVRRAFELDELPPHVLYEAPTVAALGRTVEALASGAAPALAGSGGGSQVRAQLRRSGLEASAARRRGR
ncbi:type I polyketide synthase [Nonomuraea roseoviolacea]|uniref:Acyl transferase domain-containing protein/acyl carrier protein n=1 Tax=Nonomuraea roseoviolacea subsp. carminata TaxID=160689 RepID=A0ABT1K4Q5_9ACTN|nr:type I polyketide synthase [Nonomuraea roseoviolacea]MCP2348992.1 acyl transferase domain-containing protein/acyl carrier protein [Nonomuraea roseoviolacea subsp. carminata]